MATMSEADIAKIWLLIQFRLIQALGNDWFTALAIVFFALAFFEYGLCIRNRLPCFEDEAELIAGRIFGNQNATRRIISYRSPLHPLLRRVQELCPAVAAAGTGSSFAEERNTLTGQMEIVDDASDNWKFSDFPVLKCIA